MSVFGVGITFLYIIFTRLQHVTGTECQVIVTLGAQLLDKKTKTTGSLFCETMKNLTCDETFHRSSTVFGEVYLDHNIKKIRMAWYLVYFCQF